MCPIPPPPPGTWCNVPCNGTRTACTILDEILMVAQADQAAQPPRIGPGVLTQLTALVTKCSRNFNPTPLPQAQHCQKVNEARTAAGLHNWPLCIQHMEHGH